jgi:Maltokinase N-terminal cap domain
MAVIHKTTLVPTKLELLTAWLPSQPWYAGGEDGPALSRAGGFRLDDPAGEVGIELMVTNDVSGPRPVSYHVPVTYRRAPLASDEGLVGTTEHGVLGTRWVYDGVHDPVFVAQVLTLLNGQADPQHQTESHTPDPTVQVGRPEGGRFTAADVLAVDTGTAGTDVLGVTFASGSASREVRLHLVRVLSAEHPSGPVLGMVESGWKETDGVASRGPFLVVENVEMARRAHLGAE